MELSLTKLPWYAQIGAFVVLAVGGCGIFYYYYEMPVRADMSSRESQLRGAPRRHHQGPEYREAAAGVSLAGDGTRRAPRQLEGGAA